MSQGRIYRRAGSPYWWIGYYYHGQQKRELARYLDKKKKGTKIESIEENRGAAEEYLQDKVNRITTERYGGPVFIGPEQERIKVNEILDDLVEHYKPSGKRGIPRQVNPQMESHLKRVRDYFGDRRAMSVDSKDIEAFVPHLKQEGKQNATINRSLHFLASAYRYAVSIDPPRLPRAIRIQMLDESGNRRKGKFTAEEAELVASSLPDYMADVARFAYQTGARSGEILELRWSFLDGDAIAVPSALTKSREGHSIALTPEIEEILDRRQAAMSVGCDLIFHNGAKQILNYQNCWRSACVGLGLGAWYCRGCRDADGAYISKLDAEKKCLRCGMKWGGRKWRYPKYIGKLFHDYRRSAAHELWKLGSPPGRLYEGYGASDTEHV